MVMRGGKNDQENELRTNLQTNNQRNDDTPPTRQRYQPQIIPTRHQDGPDATSVPANPRRAAPRTAPWEGRARCSSPRRGVAAAAAASSQQPAASKQSWPPLGTGYIPGPPSELSLALSQVEHGPPGAGSGWGSRRAQLVALRRPTSGTFIQKSLVILARVPGTCLPCPPQTERDACTHRQTGLLSPAWKPFFLPISSPGRPALAASKRGSQIAERHGAPSPAPAPPWPFVGRVSVTLTEEW